MRDVFRSDQDEPSDSFRQRDVAEGFGSDAERYGRARPTYPKELIEAIVGACPGRRILDVGCGTGISSRLFKDSGCSVLGIDPDERMAALAAERGIDVEIGSFETWDARGRLFDAVTAGQAWHWVDPVHGATKAAAVLVEGGRLAAFWNVGEADADVTEAFSAVYRNVVPQLPISNPIPGLSAYAAMFETAESGIDATGRFTSLERWRFDWERTYTREEWLDQVPTFGGHNRFSPTALSRLLDGLGNAVDSFGGSFVMRYAAVVVTAVRK